MVPLPCACAAVTQDRRAKEKQGKKKGLTNEKSNSSDRRSGDDGSCLGFRVLCAVQASVPGQRVQAVSGGDLSAAVLLPAADLPAAVPPAVPAAEVVLLLEACCCLKL